MSELILMVRRDSDPEDQWTRLLPDTYDLQVPENESLTLEFRGPNAPLLEQKHLEREGDLQRVESGRPKFSWKLSENAGAVAYGWKRLRVYTPNAPHKPPQNFYVHIIPSTVNVEQWTYLFEDVRRVADALVTKWLGQQNPHVGGLALRSAKFSPAAAMAEMQEEWEEFVASLYRITRSPRTEFRSPSPQTPEADPEQLPEPICDANIYENALVALTVERLVGTLQRIGRRAVATKQDAIEMRDLYRDLHSYVKKDGVKVKEPHPARVEAEKILGQSERLVAATRERSRLLQRMRRKLPGRPHVAASRGRIPQVTPRIRHHPDYNRVIQWYRAFGHQQLTFSSQQFLSALGGQRASTLYEYWCLLALFSGLAELGYTPQFQQFSELVREDVLDLELWSDRPIVFTRDNGAETLTIWYERQARFLPGLTTTLARDIWEKTLPERAPVIPPGLYSRTGPLEPDFWFELRRGTQFAVGVGDAIFSEGVDAGANAAAGDIQGKMRKVSKYVGELMLVDSGRPWAPLKNGLVVFCGHFEHLPLIDEHNDQAHILVPLRPLSRSREDALKPSITLDPRSLQLIEGFLQKLRGALGGGGA